MDFFRDMFEQAPCPPAQRAEVGRLVDELIRIGRTDDFLSERPGTPFNLQCRHARGREIGVRLNDIGGVPLMEYVQFKIRRKLTPTLAAHMGYCWSDIGKWIP